MLVPNGVTRYEKTAIRSAPIGSEWYFRTSRELKREQNTYLAHGRVLLVGEAAGRAFVAVPGESHFRTQGARTRRIN